MNQAMINAIKWLVDNKRLVSVKTDKGNIHMISWPLHDDVPREHRLALLELHATMYIMEAS